MKNQDKNLKGGTTKQILKNKSGITLIALVITVIVLLILAGVAISMALNEGNLFDKANEAKTSWNRKVEEENGINNVLAILNTLTDGNNGNGGGGSTLPEGWDSTKVASTVTGTITVDGEQVSVTAPIPTGFTASDISTEDEISEGLVIYQGTEQVSTDTDAATTRNQFVWIPVYDINSMIMCKNNTSSNRCNIILEDGELKCTTHTTAGATNMCGRTIRSGLKQRH